MRGNCAIVHKLVNMRTTWGHSNCLGIATLLKLPVVQYEIALIGGCSLVRKYVRPILCSTHTWDKMRHNKLAPTLAQLNSEESECGDTSFSQGTFNIVLHAQ